MGITCEKYPLFACPWFCEVVGVSIFGGAGTTSLDFCFTDHSAVGDI